MAKERKFVIANNHKWAYLRYGKGEPLVILHGYLATADFFVPVANLLKDSFELIIPDLPGNGFTPKLKNNTYKNIALELAGFTKAIGLDKFILFGFSMGGAVALEYSLNNPKAVTSLIVQSGVWRPKALPLDLERRKLNFYSYRKILDFLRKKPVLDKIFTKVLEKMGPDNQKLLATYQEEIFEALTNTDIAGNQELFNSLQKVESNTRIKDLAVKPLLIVGEYDGVIVLQETLDLAELIKNEATVIVMGQGHHMMFTAPEKLALAIKTFAASGGKAIAEGFHWW